jgi:excisionase family DNA binding protein
MRMAAREKLCTAAEAAAYLDVHVETLRRMARDKRIPCAKIGYAWRFRMEDLDEFMARGGTLMEEHSQQ